MKNGTLREDQLTFSLPELRAKHSLSPDLEKDLQTQGAILRWCSLDSWTTTDPSGFFGKTCLVSCTQTEDGILVPLRGRWHNSGMGSATGCWTLHTSEHLNGEEESSLLHILQDPQDVQPRFYLSARACRGILAHAKNHQRTLPELLAKALSAVVVSLAGDPERKHGLSLGSAGETCEE